MFKAEERIDGQTLATGNYLGDDISVPTWDVVNCMLVRVLPDGSVVWVAIIENGRLRWLRLTRFESVIVHNK